MELIDRCNALSSNPLTSHEKRYTDAITDMIDQVTNGTATKQQILDTYQDVLDHIGGTDANFNHYGSPLEDQLKEVKVQMDALIADFVTWLNT
jgi:hypothetical protein